MRIAFVNLRITTDGVNRVLSGVLPFLVQKHQIRIFSLIHQNSGFPEVDKFVTSEFNLGNDPLSQDYDLYANRTKFKTIRDKMLAWKPDVIITVGSKAVRYTNWLSHESKIPTIAWFHGEWDVKKMPNKRRNPSRILYEKSFSYKGFEMSGLGRAKGVLCVSEDLEKKVMSRFSGVPCRVVHNGVDPKVFFPTWEDENYVLSVGRFSQDKNFEFIINSLSNLKYRTVIHGTVGKDEISSSKDYFERLNKLAQGFSNANIVLERHDTQEALVRRYQTCSIFVNACRVEAFGLATLEGMACGKPVIAQNSGGSPELVGTAGLLLENDGTKWADAVKDLMSSESLRQEYGRKALARSKEFSWQRTGNELERAIYELIG